MTNTFTNLLTRFCANTPPCFGKRSSQCALRSKGARYFLSLFVLLTLGIGQMWGDETITWSGTSLDGVSSTHITAGTATAVDGSTYKAGTISINSSKIQTESKKHQTNSYYEDFSAAAQQVEGGVSATGTARIELPFTVADGYTYTISDVGYKMEQGGGGGPAVHAFIVQGSTATWLNYTAAATIALTGKNIALSAGSAKLVFVLGLASNLDNNRQFKFSNISIKGAVAEAGSCTNVGIGTQPTSPVAATVGSACSISGLVASGTNPTYKWYSCNSDGSSAVEISAAGAMSFTGYTTATLGLTPTAEGATYYKCVVSGDCGDPVTSNVVTVNASPSYTVTYNDNGKTGGGAAPSDATAYASGAEVTVKGNPNDMTKTNCVFMGWNTKADGTGTIYMEGEKFNMPSENTTLYAMWGVKLSWVVQVNVAETAVTTTSTASSYTTSVAAPSNLALTDLTVTSSSKTTATNKISTTKAKGGYISATFEVQDGYEFTPTHMVLKTTAISEAITVEVNVGDEVQTWAQPKSGADPDLHIYKFADPEAITGSGTMKIYAYGGSDGTKGYRLGTPIEIYGFVAEAAAPDPSTKRVYLKCGSTWCNDSPKFFVHSWGSADNDAELTLADCETDVYYADIPASNTSLLFTRQNSTTSVIIYEGDDFWGKSQNITIGDNDLFTCTGWSDGLATFSGSTYAAPSYTISFNNGGGTGTMSAIADLACGADQTITANTFTKAGYAFANWTADVAVTVGGETVAAGSAIADGATIQNISGNITLTAAWTQAVPTSVSVDGTWRCFPGQTISLTATPTGGTSDFTYQWQKYVTSDWQDIDGADEATYSKTNCTISDCGSYRCIVSKLGGSVESNAFDVHIYTLNGNYNGSDWVSNNIALVSGTTGEVELSLEAGRLYKFKVKDNFANYWFGNSGYMLKSESSWACPKDGADIRVFTGAAGTYTFTVDIANVNYGTPEVAVSVTYPSVTHPVAGYVYYDKGSNDWENVAAHWWKSANDEKFAEWNDNPWLTQSVEICGTTYYYMPKLEGYDRVIFHKPSASGEGNQTPDITVDASSSGKYISGNSTEWTAFANYTVTFNSNGGSAVASQEIASCGTASEPADPTRLNYDFEGWQLAGVDYDFATAVTANITLDAVWTRKAIAGSEADITLVGSTPTASKSPLTSVLYYNKSYTSGDMSMAGGMGGDVSSRTDARYVGFTLPADHTATVYVKGKGSSDRKIAVVTEANRAASNWTGAFLELTMTGTSNEISGTSTELSSGTYCVGSEGSGLTLMEVTVHVNIPAPSVKLKVNGVVTQTISISVGEKLGEIFVSGSLPTLDLPGYTFNGWKNEVGDAAVNDNTVISGSMVIYADLTADEYDVTLENGETDGAATVHYGDEALTITTDVTGEEGDVLNGFYTAASEGTKVAEDDGTLVASVTGYTDENGKWIKESDATLYAIWTPYVPSSDATLSDLTVGGTTVTGFDAATISYDVELPFGTTVAPTVAGTATDTKAKSVVVTQASSANGDATVVVTAEDNSTKTYTVHFSVVATKDLLLVFKTGSTACVGTPSTSTQILSNNAAVSSYINQITFTNVEGAGDNGAEGSSLNVGKKAGNMFTLSAKPGFAMKSMNFNAKIQDATCEYSINGGDWTELASTNTGGDECYAVFSNAEVHEFRLRSTGTSGVWIRNMQLTMIQACTPKAIAWTAAPASEYEVGASVDPIAASANNGTVSYAASNGAITVNASTGALTINSLTNDIDLTASVAAGDGVTYCDEAASVVVEEIKTYYLVTFDKQNETAVSTVKYYSGDAAIALPATPSYSGYVFQGWFDAASGGTQITEAITPTASRTVYAQWEAQCTGPMITTQPGSTSYIIGHAATTLVAGATAGDEGELTYTWYSCDDEERTNPVVLAGAPTPSTAAVGTQYYYFTVTEAGCDVVRTSDVAVISVVEKDPICIIKATPTTATEATADGACKGSAAIKSSGKKLSSKYDYVAVELASGFTFHATDKVVLNQSADLGSASDITKFYIFTEVPADGKTYLTVNNASPVKGDNWFNMPAEMEGESALYIGRVDSKCNPTVGYLAVYRACAPILNKVTVNGVEGTPNATNHIAMEVPFSTTQSQLEDIAYTWVSNNDEWTAAHEPDVADAWAFGVENTVTFVDKDGDESVYYITISKATASSDATLASLTVNGLAIALEEDKFVYDYEFAFGTTETPVVAAVANDENRKSLTITQAASASGTATVEVVAEDDETSLTYTIHFSVSLIPSYVIYDGSKMTDIASRTGSDVSTGFSYSMGSSIAIEGDPIASSWKGKDYANVIKGFKPTDNANNIVSFVIPENYMAKVRLVGTTNSTGTERKMFIAMNASKDVADAISDDYIITSSTYDAQGFVTDFLPAGTYYLGSTDSYRLYEFSVQLYHIDVTREVPEGIYGTICLPNGGIMIGATIFEVAHMTYVNDAPYKVFFDEVIDGVMEAGMPYIFLPKEGVTNLAVTYTDAANASAGNYHGLYGTLEQMDGTQLLGKYIFYNNSIFASENPQNWLNANRAYIVLSEVPDYITAPAPGRRRVSMGFNGTSTTTGVEAVTGDGLQGTEIQKLLINGQLYIIRGQKMFDATGRLVK